MIGRKKLTFDQIVYTAVALPTLFFGSYVITIVFSFWIVSFIVKRFQLEKIDTTSNIGSKLGDSGWIIVSAAVVALVPALIMTARFFRAGWPVDPVEPRVTGDTETPDEVK